MDVAEVLLETVLIADRSRASRCVHQVHRLAGSVDCERAGKRQGHSLSQLDASSTLHIFPCRAVGAVKVVPSGIDQGTSPSKAILHDGTISQRSLRVTRRLPFRQFDQVIKRSPGDSETNRGDRGRGHPKPEAVKRALKRRSGAVNRRKHETTAGWNKHIVDTYVMTARAPHSE